MKLIKIAGGKYSAVINLSRGANAISLRYGDLPILREPKNLDEKPDSDYLYGMPLLFPVNRIEGGEFTFEGRKYSFGINEKKSGCYLHGILHSREFLLIESGESYVKAALNSDEGEIYEGFPHAFGIEFTYSLSDSGLDVRCEVFNRSDENMPSLIGYHTTFNSLLGENVLAKVPIKCEFERNMTVYLPNGKMPEPDSVTKKLSDGSFCPLSEPISRHYLADDGAITLEGGNIKIVYENCPELSYRLIYNGEAEEYICLEPQNCLINGVNKEIGEDAKKYDIIPPRSSIVYTSKIYITER
jgi:aldose 1-epimerase